MIGPPLQWRQGDRCYVPRRGTGLVSKAPDAERVSVLFDNGRVAVVAREKLRLYVESPSVAGETEASVLEKVTMALKTCGGVHVMRNTVGAVKKGGRYIRYGLEVGSADIVAIVAPHGRWLCIETKRPKGYEATEAQEKWLRTMRGYGAVVGVCRTAEEALRLVELARKNEVCW